MIEQRILDALHEQPATKLELVETLNAREGTIATALRRMVLAKEIAMLDRKRGMPALYRPLVETTKIVGKSGTPPLPVTKVWNPATDPKPDFLRREGA